MRNRRTCTLSPHPPSEERPCRTEQEGGRLPARRTLTRSGRLAVTHLRGGASSWPWPPHSSRRLQWPGSRMVFFLFPVGRGFFFVFSSLVWSAAIVWGERLLSFSSRHCFSHLAEMNLGGAWFFPFSPPPSLDHRVSSQFSPSIGGSSWVLTRTAQKPPHVGMTPLCASGTSL